MYFSYFTCSIELLASHYPNIWGRKSGRLFHVYSSAIFIKISLQKYMLLVQFSKISTLV